MSMDAGLQPGFARPVLDAQRCFRELLAAMSRPGLIVKLPSPQGAPEPFMPAAAALALTLLDLDTPVFLAGAADAGNVRQYLRFHCNCPLTGDTRDAAFAFLCNGGEIPPLTAFRRGDPEYPDRAATLVIQVEGLSSGTGVRLTGPGIETEAFLSADGLDHKFWPAFQSQREEYPLGVDVFLVSGNRAAGLPRSLRVEL